MNKNFINKEKNDNNFNISQSCGTINNNVYDNVKDIKEFSEEKDIFNLLNLGIIII